MFILKPMAFVFAAHKKPDWDRAHKSYQMKMVWKYVWKKKKTNIQRIGCVCPLNTAAYDEIVIDNLFMLNEINKRD